MQLNEYTEAAKKFAVFPSEYSLIYPLVGLANESGEALGKLKKLLRGDAGGPSFREAMADELGDVLWYLAASASAIGFTLEEVAERNLDKLARRQANGTIKGNGDKR